MILAELEVYHSRPVAPTRRLALGGSRLPVDPAPGSGGILLGGIVATNIPGIDPDLVEDLRRLTLQLEHGERIAQPRFRYRLQTDRIGLTRSVLRLRADAHRVRFDFDEKAAPAQYVLAAVYAAGEVDVAMRPAVLGAVRRGLDWIGPVGPAFIGSLSGTNGPSTWSVEAFQDPIGWALGVLDMDAEGTNRDERLVQRRFRKLVRDAHPDHGAGADGAAERIAALTAARRILLA